jgi:hypothetical protein
LFAVFNETLVACIYISGKYYNIEIFIIHIDSTSVFLYSSMKKVLTYLLAYFI